VRFGRILFVIVAVASFALDRLTKLLVEQQLRVGEQVSVIGDLLQLRHVRNRGIAFGLFSDAGMLVVVGTLIVGVLLFVFMLRVQPDDLLTITGGALITGGAMGNLVDRVQYHYVVDFLHLPSWPTFNVADVCITVGVVLVLLAQLVAMRRELREERATGATKTTGEDSA
jgi:signal peptidase II